MKAMNKPTKRTLPRRPHLDHLRAEAKAILKQQREQSPGSTFQLSDVQHTIAQEYGFESWPKLKAHVEQLTFQRLDPMAWLRRSADPPYKEPHPSHSQEWWMALAGGDAEAVRKFLPENNADQPGGPLDRHPLHYACCFYVNSIDLDGSDKALLSAGADPNASYIDPSFPDGKLSVLWGACGVKKDIEAVRLLLEAGANPNDFESLYHTAEHNNLEMLQLLLDNGAEEKGTNALIRALDFDRTAQVRMLLEYGAEPNFAQMGENALHHAIRRGRTSEFMNLLLEFGADTTLLSKDGLSVVSHAALRGAPGVFEWAIATVQQVPSDIERYIHSVRKGNGQVEPSIVAQFTEVHLSLPCQAIMTGEVEQAKRMIESGWPINSPDDGSATGSKGATPIHCAAYIGNVPLVQFFIDRGADINYPEPGYGGTPMGWAVHGATFGFAGLGDHAGVIRLLRKLGAQVIERMDLILADDIEEALYSSLD